MMNFNNLVKEILQDLTSHYAYLYNGRYYDAQQLDKT